MKQILLERLNSWTQQNADAFHKNAFVGHPDEDFKYIWEKHTNGWLLYRDTDAKFFSDSGTIYKLSKISNINDWISHEKLYSVTTVAMEKPVHYEDFDEYNFTIVQRPNNQLGESFSESMLLGKVNKGYVVSMIDSHKELFNAIKISNKYPVPPKWCLNSNGGFWTDFKYWKYTEAEYITFYEHMINKMCDFFKINIDDVDIWN
jgi:hypothetical protein